jgi:hypothetical protein
MIDPDIKQKIEEAKSKGKEATEEDFESLVNDEFLKRLNKCVD